MLNSILLKIYIVSLIAAWMVIAEFPDNSKFCKYGDEECFKKIINYFAKEKYAGDESINLSTLDPLPIRKLIIKRGADNPININLLFTNNVAVGLKTAKVLEVKGFGKNLATIHKVVFKSDYFQMLGDYNITGKVLILPIHGAGKSNMTMIEPTYILEWTGVPYEKDGETYMKMDKFTIDVRPKKLILQFDNLFNDKILSDNMNKFLTENWMDVYNEIRVPLCHGMSLNTKEIINEVFAKYPYNKFFVE